MPAIMELPAMKKNLSYEAADQVIVVDSDDRAIGQEDQAAVHREDGILHRGGAVYLFDDEMRLLVQRRSLDMRLWPGRWSNSCSSHPCPGENQREAAGRNLSDQLGVPASTPLQFLFKFRYRVRYGQAGAENEVSSVYIGRVARPGRVNPREVADFRLMAPEQVDKSLKARPDHYTPWLHLGWKKIRTQYWSQITKLYQKSYT